MAGESEAVLTFKGGPGYEAPWLVLHAPSITALWTMVQYTQFEGPYQNAMHAIAEANALADVKATLGATETTTSNMPTPPVAEEDPLQKPANATLIAVAAKKSGKSKESLAGITKAEATRLIQEGNK